MAWKLAGPVAQCAHGFLAPCPCLAPCSERWFMNLWLNEAEGLTIFLGNGKVP